MSNPANLVRGARPRPDPTADALRQRFLSILPAIERHGRVYFRRLKCRHRLQEVLAEMVALCWKWFLRLVEQVKDTADFPTTLAAYAARAVRSGRRLCGQEKSKDGLSPLAQQRRHFSVQSLPAYETGTEDNATIDALIHSPVGGIAFGPVGEALLPRLQYREAGVPRLPRRTASTGPCIRDDHRTPPPDAAAFRIDFPAWLKQLGERNGKIAGAMALGEKTRDLADKYGTSQARISQLRREFKADWERFTGNPVVA